MKGDSGMKRIWLAGAIVALSTILGGCAGGGVYVRGGPPAPRYAIVGRAPGPGYVWTNGFWDWRGGRWSWMEGRWMHAPRGHSVWVGHEWRNDGGRWRFHRGYWR